MFRFVQRHAPRVIALSAAALTACTEEIRLGLDRVGSGASIGVEGGAPAVAGASGAPTAGGLGGEFPLGGAGGAQPDGETSADAAVSPCVQRPCRNQLLACGNCRDDDEDGVVDASDPACLGPCDDSEAELQSGPVMVSGSCNADCYFDLNEGGGDDGCDWNYRCDPLSLEPRFDPTASAMCAHDPALAICNGSQLESCRQNCRPLTPNGCDCFGCCEVPAGSERFIWLGSGNAERPCTPVEGCQNPCEQCELCVGRPELPATCSPDVGPSCPVGVRACDPLTQDGCAVSEYCITGCCVPLPT
jgi:hypothetical protein